MSSAYRGLLATLPALVALTAMAFADVKVKVDADVDTPKAKVKGITATRIDSPIAFSLDDSTIELKPLDAPDNPYVKVYTDWDRWVVKNARPDLRFSDLKWVDGRWVAVDPQLGDLDVTVAHVDSKGYLIPVADKSVLDVGPRVPVLPRTTSGGYYVIAAGTAAPEVRKVYVRERAKVLAPVAPRVPDWVIKQPASRVLFTPDGDLVVQRDNIWYRYDGSGKVIAQTKPGQSWRVLYWPQYGEVVTTAPAKKYTVLDDSGYVVVRDNTGKVVTVYDYDGTPVKVDEVKVDRAPFYYTPLDWDTVTTLHDAQVSVDADGDVKVKVD